MRLFALLLPLTLIASAAALDNGLALTPPMGWLAWERFRCNTKCDVDPDNCISEKLFMQMADVMASEGYLEAGYDIVSLDDCWSEMERDADDKLVGDLQRFPSGIDGLADYIHGKGIRFGMYNDYGTHTCGGYPGVIDHMELDAQTFADWGVDYVKLDGCYSEPEDMDDGYPEFGSYMNATGRPMVYSCSWPVYQTYSGMQPNWTAITATCNLWRNWGDIQDSWNSVKAIIDYFGNNQDELIPIAGPGHWNDPDMLIIGNFGLSYEQSKAQMAIWAILAAPLIMSNDLRNIGDEYKQILLNKDVIAVNQDSLGLQGKRMYIREDNIEVWRRHITPVDGVHKSAAVVLLSNRVDGMPFRVLFNLPSVGLNYEGGYKVTDLFDGTDYGVVKGDDVIPVNVAPTGVVMLRCVVNA